MLFLAVALAPITANAGPPAVAELRKLHDRVDSLLKAELTEHWYPHALDLDLGGFHQNFARDWSPTPDDNRSLVYQSRMTWTAAAFAEYSEGHRAEFEKYARYGLQYLDEVMRDRQAGGFHWSLDTEGRLGGPLGDEKHVYGTAFVLYAASTASRVTRDELASKVARDAFRWLETTAHDDEYGGYIEAVSREGTPIRGFPEDAPLARRTDRLNVYYGFKSMNAHIHLLEAVAAFSLIDNSPLVKRRLREVHEIVRDKIAAAPGGLNLYFSKDWHPAPAHDSFGHDVETAFLLVESAHALGMPDDARTWRVARSLVDHALDWGWDDANGGFYDKGDAFAGGALDTTKIWWTQAEGLNALLLMHAKYGAQTPRYWDAFKKQWSFIEAHQLDPEHGGWIGEVTREGKLLGDGRKATPWKANYHTSRALMNVATTLGELAGE